MYSTYQLKFNLLLTIGFETSDMRFFKIVFKFVIALLFAIGFALLVLVGLNSLQVDQIDMTGIGNCGTPRCVDQ